MVGGDAAWGVVGNDGNTRLFYYTARQIECPQQQQIDTRMKEQTMI